MNFLREKLIGLIASGETVNKRLVLLVALGVAAVVAILVSLNSAKPIPTNNLATAVPLPVVLPDCYVHVVGEVKKPGIYDLPSDSRVFEAIFAAGGFTDKADEGSINLARAIGDGEQIIVLAKGQTSRNVSPESTINHGCSVTKPNVQSQRYAAAIIELKVSPSALFVGTTCSQCLKHFVGLQFS